MIITSPYVPDPEGYEGGRAFGLTIRGRRMGAGLTLRRCAEDMGISMTDLSSIERGLVAMTTEQRERFEGALRAARELADKAEWMHDKSDQKHHAGCPLCRAAAAFRAADRPVPTPGAGGEKE